MKPLRVLDLFSGIGGFSLGLEWAGMETVAFCEQDGYACQVLRKHWPTTPIFEDVRTLNKTRLKAHGIEADLICGGFPCQDLSFAGKGAGIDGERSGLWREFARLIGEIRPRYAIVENVPALRSRGLGRVLGDLAAIGYDAEWHCIPASAVGAPHQRDRIWIVAYPKSNRCEQGRHTGRGQPGIPLLGRFGEALADALGVLDGKIAPQPSQGRIESDALRRRDDVPDAMREHGVGVQRADHEPRHVPAAEGNGFLPDADGLRHENLRDGHDQTRVSCGSLESRREALPHPASSGRETRRADGLGRREGETGPLAQRGWWPAEPDLPRVVDGLPHRVDRLRCLGNAVVPQIVYLIGRAIIEDAKSRSPLAAESA